MTKRREGERQDDKCSVDLQEIGGKSRMCWLGVYLVTDRFQTLKHRDTCLLGSMKSRRQYRGLNEFQGGHGQDENEYGILAPVFWQVFA